MLKIGADPEIAFHELDFNLRLNLKKDDWHRVEVLRRYIDLENIRALLRREPLDLRGNFDQNELEDHVLFREGLPGYILDYLENYSDTKQRLEHFTELLHTFYETEKETQTGFLQNYITFEWQWRIVLVALRAKDLNRPFTKEFRGYDLEDPFVSFFVSQQDAKSIDVPEQYLTLRSIYEKYKSRPYELNKALLEWRFDMIENKMTDNPFTMDRVLGFLAQLLLVEKWQELDAKKGKEFVETVTRNSL